MATPSGDLSHPGHLKAIRTLAAETHRPEAEVNRLYREAFGRLNEGALVKDFLILQTCREVRDLLDKASRSGNTFACWVDYQ